MYTRRNYSLTDMAWWTRCDTFLLLMIALVPVILCKAFDQRWLHLPWPPIALIGTAVAFLISFQNKASYDRVWEARKIWGDIVNTSRAWGIVVNDFIRNDFTPDHVSDTELAAIREQLIFRHMAMSDILVELYALQGKSERIESSPYPRQYAALDSYFL